MTPSQKKPARPSDVAVAKALGPTQQLWDDIRLQVSRDGAPITEEWVFGGQKHGWALRLKRKERAVLYLKPLEHYFRASLAMGTKAVELARVRQLPAEALRLIDEAIQYPEGKAVRIDIRAAKDVQIALQLVAIKLET